MNNILIKATLVLCLCLSVVSAEEPTTDKKNGKYMEFSNVHPSRMIMMFYISGERHHVRMVMDSDTELPLISIKLPMHDIEAAMGLLGRELLNHGIIFAYYHDLKLCVFVQAKDKEEILRYLP